MCSPPISHVVAQDNRSAYHSCVGSCANQVNQSERDLNLQVKLTESNVMCLFELITDRQRAGRLYRSYQHVLYPPMPLCQAAPAYGYTAV